ncbi:MAG: hypothetical protein INR62_11370, partial [Rhodospirillales bacterium]|nr:hypothetical protein [Acetobacter sp.]
MHFLPHYAGQFWPSAASSMAREIDLIFAIWCVVLFVLVAPVFAFMAYCSAKYRAGRVVNREHTEERNMRIEVLWIVGPFII